MPSRRDWLRVMAGSLLVGSLTACGGWYPRGTRRTSLTGRKFFIKPVGGSQIENYFATEMSYVGVTLTGDRSKADVIVELSNASFDRRVLSVDPATGKVREVELGLEVQIEVRAADGTLILAPEKFSWYQDFVFDEGSLIGTQEVESGTRMQLEREAARSLALRIESLDLQRLSPRGP
jgi:outer membrane lipopolysaccharide assembly protein LptE/RlpB